ncbi:hypothetical protein [Mucilaginibacter sp. KACC 22063]|uniref:hypothetical protein n=1 Tax=Mucilaginibacter sp. KACC 22063 TaxID=3025666 RepID=UPI002365659E|nr:hypothetical protein [Mucilaginibacter sp. KACC 22063]WDF57210.1 hypothetical protein PQ461_09100 [Mucilaginibacter sp. KACC 22063]
MNINHFGPFSPDVWGSVSDWVYIIVTTATLYFIYRTFRSQLEVQRMQLRITDIENERYRQETLPVFYAEILEDQPNQPSDPNHMLVSIGFGLKKHECKNVKLTVASDIAEKLEWTHLAGNFQYVGAGGANLIDVLITKKQHGYMWMFPIQLTFHFQDMVGNSYEQNIHCLWRGSGKHQILSFTPVPIMQ